jgi:hypothetical protein
LLKLYLRLTFVIWNNFLLLKKQKEVDLRLASLARRRLVWLWAEWPTPSLSSPPPPSSGKKRKKLNLKITCFDHLLSYNFNHPSSGKNDHVRSFNLIILTLSLSSYTADAELILNCFCLMNAKTRKIAINVFEFVILCKLSSLNGRLTCKQMSFKLQQ